MAKFFPSSRTVMSRGGTRGGAEAASFDRIEILGGNVIAVLQTSIVNHEEEPEITYRGIFKDADEPVQKAPKPIDEYVWVDILGKNIEEIPSKIDFFQNLIFSERQQVRDHILLPNNLGIGLLNNTDLVWVGVYVIPFSRIEEMTSEDGVADFFASIPRGTVINSRFDYRIELEDWDGKAEEEAELEAGEELPPRAEKIYLPWSSL